MFRYSSLLLCISFILACSFFSKCYASDDNRKLYIVYMGSLPETEYYPTSHHLEMLQHVLDENDATKSLIHSYKRSFNGFAAMLTEQQNEKIKQMKGVVSVFPSINFHLHTTQSWDFVGVSKSVKRRGGAETNVVVGLLDSGIWPEADSFKDEGFGPFPKHWNGACAGGKNFTCNKKLIGARYYVEDSARDSDGHGTHTAATAAGIHVRDANFYGLAKGTARGGAPLARIAAYKVCSLEGCGGASILSGFDDAIADGVNIISVSLGSSFKFPFELDPIAIGSFHAIAKGVLTVHSAGNSGPDRASVSSVAPWLFTIAASTTDRKFISKVVLGNGKILKGKSINTFSFNGTKFPIAKKNVGSDSKQCPRPGLFPNRCDCIDGSFVNEKIFSCEEITNINSINYNNIQPKGVILQSRNTGPVAFVGPIPYLVLPPTGYEEFKSYTNSTKNPKAEIQKSETVKDVNAPQVAYFSSRGPNNVAPEFLKPDISAPGVEIMASFSPAVSPSGQSIDKRVAKYNIISGTSMSCPHVSGMAAYLKSFHWDWSPACIKSALMTSAKPMKGSKDEVGEYAYGSGHVNPIPALQPGLVYDISSEEYIQVLCNLGYDNEKVKAISGKNNACSKTRDTSLVRNLNYPSFASSVKPETSFTFKFKRIVTNVGQANSTYKATILPNPKLKIQVEPETLSFKSLKEKKSFVVIITGGKLPIGTLTSSLVWFDGKYKVKSPIVIEIDTHKY